MFDLRTQLANTGLFSENDPVSRGELKAYERQLNDLLAWHQQMKREMALDTTELLIQRWEKIYFLNPSENDTIRDRQISLLNKRRAQGVLTPSKVILFASDFGYKARVIKRVRPFRYKVELQNKQTVIEVAKLDAILRKSEPAHQSHDFGIVDAGNVVEYTTGLLRPIVHVSTYQICGTFSAGGEFEL
ncbi:putative phage tail protein [Brevibacillus reuszeri]|uniref:putative phage tail protein n=1 Tax=Brevibacillus reuszeri TaxID=54915 RepID=UPI000CCC3BE6|nr:putative phage tail protein [Brevibacillus reuszeri]